MSSQSFCWGGARKKTIREPVRLVHFQFSGAFRNGGSSQGQIRANTSSSSIMYLKNLQIVLARDFGARDIFTVNLLGGKRKTTVPEPVRSAHFQFSRMRVTHKVKSGVNWVVFGSCTWKKLQIFLARAFGARDVFIVISLGRLAKNNHSRAWRLMHRMLL